VAGIRKIGSKPVPYNITQVQNQEHCPLRFDESRVRPEGFEPPTLGSEDRCAIQLRHGRLINF
jgi:hypothetical protein